MSRAKECLHMVIHVLNVSHPVLSSRVARTTRRSLSTRTSRMVAELWLLQVDPQQSAHTKVPRQPPQWVVKRKPHDRTMWVMVTTDNLVENMTRLKHEVAQT